MSSPARKYFQLYLPERESLGMPAADKILLIEPTTADALYDDFRIVYRMSPFQINYYSYYFWAEKPARLVNNSIYDFFFHNNLFKKLISTLGEEKPDLVLKSKILIIEEVDTHEAWYARLAMEISLVDFSSGSLLVSHRFDRREQLPSKDVSAVPAVLSKILEEELHRVIKKASGSGTAGYSTI
jgi:ABC-type uncharacterized transport system auxiliary subunit